MIYNTQYKVVYYHTGIPTNLQIKEWYKLSNAKFTTELTLAKPLKP